MSSENRWDQIFQPSDELPQSPVIIPKLLLTIWSMRSDLQSAFPIGSEIGRKALAMWWLLWGWHEYPAVPTETLKANFEYFRSSQEGSPGLKVDRLMETLWQSREGIRNSFVDLYGADRERFLAWFLFGFVPAENAFTWIDAELESVLKGTLGESLATLYLREFEADANKSGSELLIEWFRRVDSAEKRHSRFPIFRGSTREGVNVVGHATGELGVGEDVRMLVKALDVDQIEHSVFRFPYANMVSNRDQTVSSRIRNDNPYDVNIFCLPGFDCLYAAASLGKSFFKQRYNVGFCQWELPKWPTALQPVFSIMDELWASSEFTKASMETISSIPVRYAPMVVELPAFDRLSRVHFGLAEDRKVFLFTFDFTSSVHRKNPSAVVQAFLQAFPLGRGDEVTLVIKSSHRDMQNPDVRGVAELCDRDPRIVWIHETLPRGEFLALMDVCDVFVSLHRSEGFGRNIAEAMLLKKIVIATDWSGNVDFCTPHNSLPVEYRLRSVEPHEYSFTDDQIWAEPDVSHAAGQMQKALLMTKTDRAHMADLAAHTIIDQYSATSVAKVYSRLLDELRKSAL